MIVVVNYGLKQGQITPNIEKIYVLKLIDWVTQCSKITNTVLFQKHILHDFSAMEQFLHSNVRMSKGTFCRVGVHILHIFPLWSSFYIVTSECPKVHFVALGFIYVNIPPLSPCLCY